MNTISESLGNVRQAPTAGAYLRGVVGIHPDKQPTSFFHFVGELGKELSPTRIVDRPRQHSARQAFDVQVFNSDKAVGVGQSTAELVLEVGALISNVNVGLLKEAHCLASPSPTLLASGDLALAAPELRQSSLQVAGIGDQFPVREGGKGSQSHVDTDSARGRYYYRNIDNDREAGIPLPSLPLEGEYLNLASDRSVQFELDNSHALYSESGLFGDVAPIAPGRERVAVEAVSRLEPWVARLLTGRYAPEEGSEGLIDSPKHVLASREVGQIKITRIPYLFKLIRLVVIVTAHALHSPGITALLKSSIVEGAGFGKLVLKGSRLLPRWIQAVFERLTHLLAFLTLDILSDSSLADITHRANVVTAGPKTGELSPKLGELRAQNTRRGTFKLVHNVLNRLGRLSSDKHVNVVGHNFYSLKINTEFLSLHAEHLFEVIRNVTREYLFAVLRTPYQVILDVEDTARISLVPITHSHKYITASCISQALVLKEVCRNSSVT